MRNLTIPEAHDRAAFITGLYALASFYEKNKDAKIPYLLTPTISVQARSINEGWALAKAMNYEDKEVSTAGDGKYYRWQARFGNILVSIVFVEKAFKATDFPEPTGDHDSPAATAALS